jgi:hypothetical protein
LILPNSNAKGGARTEVCSTLTKSKVDLKLVREHHCQAQISM